MPAVSVELADMGEESQTKDGSTFQFRLGKDSPIKTTVTPDEDDQDTKNTIRFITRSLTHSGSGGGLSPRSKRTQNAIQTERIIRSKLHLEDTRGFLSESDPQLLSHSASSPARIHKLTERTSSLQATSQVRGWISDQKSHSTSAHETAREKPRMRTFSDTTMEEVREKLDFELEENIDSIVRLETYDDDHKIAWYIVLPESTFRQSWDLLMGILVLYILIFLPLRFAFDDRIHSDSPRGEILNLIDMVADVLFIVDIAIMFVSAYEHNGHLYTDLSSIGRKYVKSGWFFIDCVAAFPFSFFSLAFSKSYIADVSKSTKMVRIFKLLRALKLVRLFRLKESFENLEYNPNIHAGMLRGFSLAFLLVMFGHFMGCIWYWIGMETRDHEEGSWFDIASIDPEEVDLFEAWMLSFYWSLTTLTTIGYGDLHPMNTTEMAFSIFIMLIGTLFFSFITGTFASFLQHSDELVQEYREKMGKLMTHMSKHKVPPDIRKNVQDTMSKKWKSEQGLKKVRHNMTEIYQDIPLRVLADLSGFVFREVLATTVVVKEFRTQKRLVAQFCRFIKRKVVATNEFVVLKGESPSDFFMCVKGCFILVDRSQRMDKLYDGEIFGHVAILYDIEQPWSIISVTVSTINYISGRDFLQILSMQPTFCDALVDHAAERYESHQTSDSEDGALRPENIVAIEDTTPAKTDGEETIEGVGPDPLATTSKERHNSTPEIDVPRLMRYDSSTREMNDERKRFFKHIRQRSDGIENTSSIEHKIDLMLNLMEESSTRLNKLEKHLGIHHINPAMRSRVATPDGSKHSSRRKKSIPFPARRAPNREGIKVTRSQTEIILGSSRKASLVEQSTLRRSASSKNVLSSNMRPQPLATPPLTPSQVTEEPLKSGWDTDQMYRQESLSSISSFGSPFDDPEAREIVAQVRSRSNTAKSELGNPFKLDSQRLME